MKRTMILAPMYGSSILKQLASGPFRVSTEPTTYHERFRQIYRHIFPQDMMKHSTKNAGYILTWVTGDRVLPSPKQSLIRLRQPAQPQCVITRMEWDTIRTMLPFQVAHLKLILVPHSQKSTIGFRRTWHLIASLYTY